KTVPYGFWSIHDDPKPGQSATFANAMGVERTYRVAFVRESVCTIERRLPGSDVVIAVEFELSGPIKNMVRRAWVGRVRQKPFAAEVQVPSGADSAVGLSGAAESSREEFVDL